MPQFPSDEEFDRLLKSGELPGIPKSSAAKAVDSPSASSDKTQTGVTSAQENPDTAALEAIAKEMKTSLQSIEKTFEDLSSMLKRVMEE